MPTLQADDPLARPAHPERYWVLGGLITILADAALTEGRLGVTEQRMPAGAATPLHRHPQAETFVVQEGSISVFLEGSVVTAAEGALVHVPGGAVHAFATGEHGVRMIALSTPAGHEAFFRDAGVRAADPAAPPAGPPDMERLMAAAALHEVEILGPPPAVLTGG